MAAPLVAHADDGAVAGIQRRKQRRRSVALVVVGQGPATVLVQRQTGLRPIQGLDLALLIQALHDRMFRRVPIEPHNRLQCLGEPGIMADIGTLYQVGLSSSEAAEPPARQNGKGCPSRTRIGVRRYGANMFFRASGSRLPLAAE
jgi:hypothetical protein